MAKVKRKCKVCNGTGKVDTINRIGELSGVHTCLICNGTGKIWDETKKDVKKGD
jgi:DnaJ-class molecular chaperone